MPKVIQVNSNVMIPLYVFNLRQKTLRSNSLTLYVCENYDYFLEKFYIYLSINIKATRNPHLSNFFPITISTAIGWNHYRSYLRHLNRSTYLMWFFSSREWGAKKNIFPRRLWGLLSLRYNTWEKYRFFRNC